MMNGKKIQKQANACSWCNEFLDTIEVGVHLEEGIIQGICGSCVENFLFQKGVPLRRYLDSLPMPVLVVDADMVVQTMNTAALKLQGRSPEEKGGVLRGGDVFECAQARLPGGCGRTIHCSGCSIRRTVTKTWETGEPQSNVPATLKPVGPDERAEVSMTIATYKAGNQVMLRVDRFDLGKTASGG